VAWDGERHLLEFGAAVALVIASLTIAAFEGRGWRPWRSPVAAALTDVG
jgi:hypothetical protein